MLRSLNIGDGGRVGPKHAFMALVFLQQKDTAIRAGLSRTGLDNGPGLALDVGETRQTDPIQVPGFMAERKYTHGLKLRVVDGFVMIDIGAMEIWDGADLSLIRDTLFRLIVEDGVAGIGINMRYVQYIPSGFFGMLYDWLERGVQVRLYAPRPRVQQMLWFRKFFVAMAPGVYSLHDGRGINEAESEELWKGQERHKTSSENIFSFSG